MIQFILNNITVISDHPSGITLLDFIRYERHLCGTKIGCREGDCGACTVLIGELIDGQLIYRSATSCLMPLGNANGKHIVTVEGINISGLNPVQQAMSDEGATQCGFCTPGFVVSLVGFCLQNKNSDVIASIDGNICRCTGYKSIERAAEKISGIIKNRTSETPLDFAVSQKLIPDYFSGIRKKLEELLHTATNNQIRKTGNFIFVGGGTDLYVQKHEVMTQAEAHYLSDTSFLKYIREENNKIIIGGAVTVTDLIESPIIRKTFPDFLKYSKLVSSVPIRNMATLGGNFVNASPIGDFTIFFLALDAKLILKSGKETREVNLRDFYLGYKKLDKHSDEYIEEICFTKPESNSLFNFEKVSKRTNLDIASVNSAMCLSVDDGKIIKAGISAGGVGPVPMYLKNTSDFLISKIIVEEVIEEACSVASKECTPISDARGKADYKRFLLQQLIKAHFITLIPGIKPEKFQAVYEEH